MNLQQCINVAKQYLGNQYFENVDVKTIEDKSINGLIFDKKDNIIVIKYQNKVDLFRGLTLVKENANNKEIKLKLNRTFKNIGSMLDVSRNGVLKIYAIKDLIVINALMGNNNMLLYTEDTYELDGYPYFGYLRGRYSKNDLQEIVSYGEDFGIEFIPCIQTLDHLEKPFRWDVFEDIKEGSSNLMPLEEKSYQFIEQMIKTCSTCFKSKIIHIGMDESFRLGTGKFLTKYGYHDRVDLFTKHLERVINICQKYGFTPMIWSDMFFRLNDKNSEYYDVDKLPESTINLIPKNIQLVYWDYYHEEKEIYDRMFKAHNDVNRTINFAGGSWRWSGFAPALHKSFQFNNVALQSAIEHNIKNVFVTSWGDNGSECSMYTILLSLAQYSTFNYYGNGNEEKINSLLEAVINETLERFLLLDLPNMPDNKILAAPYNPCKFFFYQDPLLGLFDKQVKDNFSINYKKHYLSLLNASKESKNYSHLYKNLAMLCHVLEIKVDIGVRIRNAYKNKDKETLKEIANKEIFELINRISEFKVTLENQWTKENKRFGFDVLDGRIGYLKERLSSASKIINDYLQGSITQIEELEKEILPYGGHDYEICWNDWSTTVAL